MYYIFIRVDFRFRDMNLKGFEVYKYSFLNIYVMNVFNK